MNKDISEASGACHCGAVRFHVRLSDGLRSARRCTCSYCRMRGAIAVSADIADFDILDGAGMLTQYQFNTGTAKHYFCSRCGVYTHHQRRSNPAQFGINAACRRYQSVRLRRGAGNRRHRSSVRRQSAAHRRHAQIRAECHGAE